MQVKVLFFGIVRDITGEGSGSFNLKHKMTVSEFKGFLREKYPKLTEIKNYAIAINESYSKEDQQICDRDVIAIIPPVSGG